MLPGNPHFVGDQIPVDYVSNILIAATANHAWKDSLEIVHAATSSINPFTWTMTIKYIVAYFDRFNFPGSLAKTNCSFFGNKRVFDSVVNLKVKLPEKAYGFIAYLV